MLAIGRLRMTQEEQDALDRLLAAEDAEEASFSMTRTEPGESGPIRVEIGKEAWHIDGAHYAKQAD